MVNFDIMHKLKLLFTLSLVITCFISEAQSIRYQINEEYKGWHPWVKENTIVGERNRRIEAIKILPFDFPAGASIQYRVRVKTAGWQPWVEAGETAGTEGEDRRIEAIEIKTDKFSRSISLLLDLDWISGGHNNRYSEKV